jgi:LuxR family transcriptional regulator, maltose regulon positive regulatory protein
MKARSQSESCGVPPLAPSYLPRPRLDRRWPEWAARKLIVATAGAGFGKTSYLAARAGESDQLCLWTTLEAADADPAGFLYRFSRAVSPLNVTAISPEEASRPEAGDRLAAQVSEALHRSAKRILFVFDDAQNVSGVPEVLRFLETLIGPLPLGCTLVLASREPVGLRTARLKSQGLIAGITSRDLQFTEEEVEALFRHRFGGAKPDRRLCRRIVAQTEGWAAGIEILMQAAGGPSSWAIERALDQLARAGSGWFSYFAEEVVSRLDDRTQQFLLRSSCLPRLDPEVCDSVLGMNDSRQILEGLSSANLFTYPVGSDPVTYRYHHLFREFLRDQLSRRSDEDEVRRLRLRVAAALARSGAWAEAAAAYAEAGDAAATLRVIEKSGEELISTGQYQAVRTAFASIPPSLLRRHPAALSILGRLEEIQGRWEEAGQTYQLALKSAPTAARRLELMALQAKIHLRRGEYDAAVALCKKALRGTTARHTKLRADVLCLLGICAAELGRLEEAEEHLTSAHALSRRGRDPGGMGRSLFLLAANVHYFRGEFQKARDTARQALLIFQKAGDQQRISHTMGVLGFLAMATAQEREARDLTEGALRLAESLSYRMVEGYCRYTLGKCALQAGEPAAAGEHFEAARRIGEELREPALLTLPRLGLAEVALAEGNRHAARETALEALRLAQRRKDRYQEAECRVLLGLAEEGRTSSGRAPAGRASAEKIRTWWKQAERIYRSMGAAMGLHRLLLLRLSSAQATGKETPALLRELLIGTAKLDHAFLFLECEPDRAARVLSRALEHGIETGYVCGLLSRLGPRAVPQVEALLHSPDHQVHERAVGLLARIGGDEARLALGRAADSTTRSGRIALKAAQELEQSAGPPLRIQALGGFALWVGNEQLPRERWRSSRAFRLLQFLLSHRFDWVQKDVVLEALWPEVEPEKSEINLRQSILLLRKTLEPELEETRFSRYVRFRGDTYRLDPGTGYTYDVMVFEDLLRQSTKLLHGGKTREAEPVLHKAVDLYRGCFLEESPYEEFLTAERQRLADGFIWAVERLLTSSAAGGRREEVVVLARRAIQGDAYKEEFHAHLIRAHLALGNRREALAAYAKYEEIMRGELDLSPSPQMRELAGKIVAMDAPKGRSGGPP